MYPTRQGWTVAALAVVLAILAVVFARPLVLVGSALIGAWLLAYQYRFTRDLERAVESLSVVQSPARLAVQTEDEIPVTLTATREATTELTLEITAGLPVTATATRPFMLSLEPAIEQANRTRTVTWPVAGRHTFDAVTVTATDGLFRETITVGSTPTVTVEPPSPQSIHVGEGGDRIAASYGPHESGRIGTGIEPVELREYLPGDTGKRIDWKATARHTTPYVREYEAESDRRTLLVVDHRSSLAMGRQSETKLEALREVVLVIAGNARRLTNPLGLVTVGDGGITNYRGLASTTVNYRPIRRRLLALEPTTAADTPATMTVSNQLGTTTMNQPKTTATESVASRSSNTQSRTGSAGNNSGSILRRNTTPTDAQRSFSDLEGTDETFARTLRPFYSDRQRYQERIAEDPLYGAVHKSVTDAQGSIWTVICTDDSRPAELRETVLLAREGGNEVLVLLAPSVLYEPDGLTDIEQAYDRYVEFEEFRRELARLDNVTVLEVGPTDRLSAIIEAGRSRGGHA
ncbi:DUF58 domain-containing protein [Natrinema sp. J7-2]|uniref:DUF58 domain-containing protein n=1 Tax=Natrinema sp. (strain J7-2) TaxID=406552 RepID=UPI0002A87C2F|nr:DUF58 domain-containing protein [Natrinema sp. J7-2]AFO59083.2 hypothetical protein NJ7G_3867 [Natrinema sp. J7-2]